MPLFVISTSKLDAEESFDKIDSANVFSWRHGGRGYYIVSHANRGWLWA